LPCDSVPQAFGHPGNLENCGACGRVLRTSKLMMQLSKSAKVFLFHGDCYLLWMEERRPSARPSTDWGIVNRSNSPPRSS
jgi:hypothetical protein